MAILGNGSRPLFAGFFDVFLLVSSNFVCWRRCRPHDCRTAGITGRRYYSPLSAGVITRARRGHWWRRERRVVVWPVSCGVAGGGAGYARAARRAGSCCPVRARRPAPQGPAAPQVGKEPLAASSVRGPWPGCRGCHRPSPGWLVSRQRAGPLPGPMRPACAGQVALALTRALHPWSERPGPRGRGRWGAPPLATRPGLVMAGRWCR